MVPKSVDVQAQVLVVRPDAHNRLTPEQAAKLLSAAAKVQIPVEHITQDIAAGAPTHADGTISLVQYAAWIVRELAHGD